MTTTLRRYTNVLSVLDMLQNKRLTLLSPKTWFDQNDAYGLQLYQELRGKGVSYALCMSEGDETAHHWQLFAGDLHGVCVDFYKDKFVEWASRQGLLHGPMRYLDPKDFAAYTLAELPFLKNKVFASEREYRAVGWVVDLFADADYQIDMPIDMIKKIVFGPAMPEKLVLTLWDILADLDTSKAIDFSRSRIGNNSK